MNTVVERPAGSDNPTRRDRLAIPFLVLASGISLTGNSLTALVIPWFVYITTGSASRTGIVAFASLLPVVVAGMAGGLVVDRVGFKRASVVSDIFSGLTVVLIPILHLADMLQFWHLLVLVFMGALLDIPGAAARQSMIPGLSARTGMSLERANAGMQMASAAAMVIGPLAAGFLMSVLGATTVLFLDAGSFAISALMVAVLVPWQRTEEAQAAEEAGEANVLRESLAGAKLILSDSFLRAIIQVSVGANLLFSALFAVALPVYAKEVFDDPRVLGLIIAGFGGGSLVGTILYGIVGERLPRIKLLLGGVALMAVGLWSLPWSTWVALSVIGAAAMGLANGPINATLMVILQERVPESHLGRVYSSLMAMVQIASPVGVVLAGFILDSVAVTVVLAGIAGLFSLIAILTFLNPEIRTISTSAQPVLTGRATANQRVE
ncbi:MAG: MFS transporter [Thermomicrobiales bacterium]|nr:MFS transporter [Thermomicrobiales bacterium]